MRENYSNQAKKEKRKNLFNPLPKTSISNSDALGMTVVGLGFRPRKRKSEGGDFEEADQG
jgi:hypothetical protein